MKIDEDRLRKERPELSQDEAPALTNDLFSSTGQPCVKKILETS